MRHHTLIISAFIVSIGFLTWSCNSSSGDQEEDSSVETSSTEEENTSLSDERANRPSPFVEISGNIDGANIIMTYSSPGVKGRKIFGGLEPYGEVWRTGANEATTIEVDKDVKIEGEILPSGKYSFFTIPKEEGPWTIIFNKVWDQWGAYEYDANEDVLRVEVMPETLDETAERLEFVITTSGQITFQWADISLPIDVTSNG